MHQGHLIHQAFKASRGVLTQGHQGHDGHHSHGCHGYLMLTSGFQHHRKESEKIRKLRPSAAPRSDRIGPGLLQPL
jgi:hypothetical protein